MKTRGYVLLVLCASVLACGRRQTDGTAPPRRDGSATIVRGSDLSGNFLQSLRNRVPSMTVGERPGECPRIQFRGQRSIAHQGNPAIYLDGTRMLDTCILNQISTMEIERVEVYPSGNAPDPNVQRSPFGVILIYRVRE